MCWFDISYNQRTLNGLTTGPLRKQPSLLKGPGTIPAYLSSMPQLPVALQIYSNMSIASSHRNQGPPHPFDTIRPTTQSPWLFILFPNVPPCGPVWHAVLSSML